MSLQKTKNQLLNLLADGDNKVIALSGKWGTGKTHLLNDVMAECQDEKIKGALYVSLFGLSSLDQIKRKLLEGVAPGADAHPKIWETAKNAVSTGIKALEGFHKGFAALNELNLMLLAPIMLRGKVIVIDDIERKHDKLGIDEILGFIDEYTKQHAARFVLVLNSNELAKKEVWDTLREKVIDHEVRLETTPEEAFSIAINLVQSRYAGAIKPSVLICGITNIRIIRRILRVANTILRNRELDEAVLRRMVPSIVLFSAIHYKGLEDGPDVRFALNIANPDEWTDYSKKDGEPESDEEKRRKKWRSLLGEMGIIGCDEFEALLVEFLESGLFDASKITPIIERYAAEKQQMEVNDKVKQFISDSFWNHRLSEQDLIDRAAELPAVAGMIDPYMATQMERTLAELNGGAGIGQQIIDAWIAAFKAKNFESYNDENPFNRPLHPAIAAEFATLNKQAQAKTTIVEACFHIMDNSGWGTMQEIAMRNATAAEFEAAIRNLDVPDLRRFMRKMTEIRVEKRAYEKHFGLASNRFVEACNSIVNDPSSPRLAKLVKTLFENSGLDSNLSPPRAVTPPTAIAAAVPANPQAPVS